MGPGSDDGDHDEADNRAPDHWLNKATLTRRGALIGMTTVAGVAAVDIGVFAYAGGWLRPGALTPSRFADRFEQVYGRHDGFRRNHSKGLSATGTFAGNGAGAAVCKAAVFTAGTVPVIGRFSLSGGLPDQPDKPDTVRGLALAFLLPNGQQWRTAMINPPVFPVSTDLSSAKVKRSIAAWLLALAKACVPSIASTMFCAVVAALISNTSDPPGAPPSAGVQVTFTCPGTVTAPVLTKPISTLL